MTKALLIQFESLPTKLTYLIDADAQESPLNSFLLLGQEQVIEIQDSHRRLVQIFQKFPFGFCHTLYRAEKLDMCWSDIGDHADGRLRYFAQIAHAAAFANAHFNNCDVAMGRQVE